MNAIFNRLASFALGAILGVALSAPALADSVIAPPAVPPGSGSGAGLGDGQVWRTDYIPVTGVTYTGSASDWHCGDTAANYAGTIQVTNTYGRTIAFEPPTVTDRSFYTNDGGWLAVKSTPTYGPKTLVVLTPGESMSLNIRGGVTTAAVCDGYMNSFPNPFPIRVLR